MNYNYKKKYYYIFNVFILLAPLLVLLFGLVRNNDTSIVVGLFNNLKSLSINNWYNSLFDSLGILINDSNIIMFYYPLYVLWYYVLCLVVQVFLLIPKLGIYFIKKLERD